MRAGFYRIRLVRDRGVNAVTVASTTTDHVAAAVAHYLPRLEEGRDEIVIEMAQSKRDVSGEHPTAEPGSLGPDTAGGDG